MWETKVHTTEHAKNGNDLIVTSSSVILKYCSTWSSKTYQVEGIFFNDEENKDDREVSIASNSITKESSSQSHIPEVLNQFRRPINDNQNNQEKKTKLGMVHQRWLPAYSNGL